MIGVESVLTKIAFALLKKATAKTAFAVVGKAVEVYSASRLSTMSLTPYRRPVIVGAYRPMA